MTLKQILLQRASNDANTTISFEKSQYMTVADAYQFFFCSKTWLDAPIDAGGATEIR